MKRCAALNLRGAQCREAAVCERGGRAVCWVHMTMIDNASRQVKFVQRDPVVHVRPTLKAMGRP